MNRIDVGDMVRIHITFRDLDGQPQDPSSVSLTLYRPSGTAVHVPSSQILHPEPGSGYYYVDFQVDEPGWWRAVWSSQGSPTVVEQIHFYVFPVPIL
ncbi:MAG: hypothetical protein RML46_06595 [Anaerolineae bacterium]|nr:hypothetical protein [Anaerolineae bacterium]